MNDTKSQIDKIEDVFNFEDVFKKDDKYKLFYAYSELQIKNRSKNIQTGLLTKWRQSYGKSNFSISRYWEDILF